MIFIPFIFFLCWGSFLNMLAWRLITGNITASRSKCTHCHHQLFWYDLIPLISYAILVGRCRFCKKNISLLYPCVEFITALSFTALWLMTPLIYFPAYFIFFSALIVTFRTDTEFMLISRFVTCLLLPFALLCASSSNIPLSTLDSIVGMILGYGFLWSIAQIFYLFTGKIGMGQGDFELMALIGAFLGPLGCWITLLLGSIAGSLLGIILILSNLQTKHSQLPFGSFLALSALCVTLLYPYLISLFLG